jgi:hypothetical protein
MKRTILKLFFYTLLAVSGVAISFGCNKKKDTLAVILVKNEKNESVFGAQVVLYGKSTLDHPANVVLYDTTVTNSSGEATFNFNDVYQLGQAGVAILNIKATYEALEGEGIIKIEEQKTNKETVYVQ